MLRNLTYNYYVMITFTGHGGIVRKMMQSCNESSKHDDESLNTLQSFSSNSSRHECKSTHNKGRKLIVYYHEAVNCLACNVTKELSLVRKGLVSI